MDDRQPEDLVTPPPWPALGRRGVVVAAVAVVALAGTVAVVLVRGSSAGAPGPGSRPAVARPLADRPAGRPDGRPDAGRSGPQQAAARAAEALISAAPMRPGAIVQPGPPVAALGQPQVVAAEEHVVRTRWWTAPGTADELISYLKAHPPAGMPLNGWGSSGGGGSPDISSLDFQAGDRTLEYDVVDHPGGVAVRADASVHWVPRRSPADRVPSSATAVDVVVVRTNPQAHEGAPTVRRTLTGASLQSLAEYVNRLSRSDPTARMSCPAMLGGEIWTDTLTFRGPGPVARVVVDLAGCSNTSFQIGHRPPIGLEGSSIDALVMRSLGLPANYGTH